MIGIDAMREKIVEYAAKCDEAEFKRDVAGEVALIDEILAELDRQHAHWRMVRGWYDA